MSLHISPLTADDLRVRGWGVKAVSLFNRPRDTLLATWTP